MFNTTVCYTDSAAVQNSAIFMSSTVMINLLFTVFGNSPHVRPPKEPTNLKNFERKTLENLQE